MGFTRLCEKQQPSISGGLEWSIRDPEFRSCKVENRMVVVVKGRRSLAVFMHLS